jgi:hypothetical protein
VNGETECPKQRQKTNVIGERCDIQRGDDENDTKISPYETIEQATIKGRRRRRYIKI